MTKLTMRTLIVAAMLAIPACASDVDTPADSPPQPAPAVSQTVQDQIILADALAEVTAQYQSMLSEQGARAAEANSTYRDAVNTLLTITAIAIAILGFAVPIVLFVAQHFSLRQHQTELRDMQEQLRATQSAVAAPAEAAAAATSAVAATEKRFRDEAATLSSNMAHMYVNTPGANPYPGLTIVVNAAIGAHEAGRDLGSLELPLQWWLQLARRGASVEQTSKIWAPDIQSPWNNLTKLAASRTEVHFSAVAQQVRDTLASLVGGAGPLEKILTWTPDTAPREPGDSAETDTTGPDEPAPSDDADDAEPTT